MMANVLDQMIAELLETNGGEETPVIAALRAKRNELGDEVTEEQAKSAALAVLMEFMPTDSEGEGAETSSSGGDDITLTAKDVACMEDTKAMVVEYLHDEEWRYSTNSPRKDIFIFDFGCTMKGVNLRIKVYVEGDPNVCRIVAYLPITADGIYAYPLCKLMAKENYSKRFGSFKYDERDGEVCYEYSVLTENGLKKDDFERYLNACIGSAVGGYATIRRYCVGRFKKAEVDDILEKINELVNDINE